MTAGFTTDWDFIVNRADVNGKLVKTLVSAELQSGTHQTKWNAKDDKENAVSTGIYFLRMDTGSYSTTKKLSVIK